MAWVILELFSGAAWAFTFRCLVDAWALLADLPQRAWAAFLALSDFICWFCNAWLFKLLKKFEWICSDSTSNNSRAISVFNKVLALVCCGNFVMLHTVARSWGMAPFFQKSIINSSAAPICSAVIRANFACRSPI